MSIADKITSIETHLVADYESLENIGAELENVDKNIENIASVVDQIYDNLPKTTGEGSSLSLNTLKGKMNTTLKGDTQQDGTPTPDTPIDIEVVTGTQEVKVENKNLWYSSEYNGTTRDLNVKFNNNKVVLNGTSSGGVDIRVVDVGNNWNTYSQAILNRLNAENTTYCGSNNSNLDVYFYMTNGTYAKTTTTTTDSIKINSIFVRVPTSTSFTNKDIEFQIEKGSTATSYVEHQEQTQTISLGNIELCKIPNTNYQDKLYHAINGNPIYDSLTSEQKALLNYGSWYKKEYISKHILSTSDTWALNRSSNNLYQYRTKNDLLEDVITSPDPYSRAVALCNYYTKGDINGMATQCFNIGGLKYIGITSDISTLANFNTFITNNNIYIYYVCQTPQDIEITNETLIEQLDNLENLMSYNGQTNIEVVGDLPMIMKVSALKGE